MLEWFGFAPAIIGGAVLLGVLDAPPETAQADGAADVRALEDIQQELARAWVRKDRQSIERILAAEWSVTTATGQVMSRQSVLADVFEAGRIRIDAVKMDDVRARVYGDTAVVTGTTDSQGNVDGAPQRVRLRFTDVFVRREGRWQAVASHASSLQ